MWQDPEIAMDVDEEDKVPDEGIQLRADLDAVEARMNESGSKEAAVAGFTKVLHFEPQAPTGPSDMVQKVKEESIYKLTQMHCDLRQFEKVMELLDVASPFFATIPKARVAKVVRSMIGLVSKMPDSRALQMQLCTEVINWCNKEKRTFLRQRIQSKLANLMFEQGKYQEAITMVNKLLRELKRFDDKQLLVEAHLVEARIHNALRNLPKSKAALTAARTAGNSIYIAPLIQAELDEMSGTLHCEEQDYGTSFSYFLEAYEARDGSKDEAQALQCLKYMMLCKVLQGNAVDVGAILAGKWGIKYQNEELTAMAQVAKAAKNRSLDEFEKVLASHGAQLDSDSLIKHHLGVLYDQLLESNLMKIIEPFSCVEIEHVAKLIKLPVNKVERRLSQMILDKKLQGILDQGRGQLILHSEEVSDKVFTDGLEVITSMGTVVSSLARRAEKTMMQ
ncbi:unnamed protein product [Chrysoparadoxa australica]